MADADSALAARVRDAATEVIARHHLPGLSLGVVRGEDLVFCEGFGFADIERATAMTPECRQRIASITKTMVGLCVLALADEGRLRLDDRVTVLLPEIVFRGPAAAMTLRHLLSHTSGMGEAATRERLRDAGNPDRGAVGPPGDFSTLFPDGIDVEVEPGSKYAYCNLGFGLLGEIVERAEGAPLPEVMQRRIFGPLRMDATDLFDQNDERIATGYHRPPNADTRFQLERAGVSVKDEPTVDGWNIRGHTFTADFNRGMRGAGGVQSNVIDMAKYASALLRRGAGIVRPDSFTRMVAPQVGADARLVRWGLGIALAPLRSFGPPSEWRSLLGHNGAYFGGWSSRLDVLPEANVAIVQHMNVMLDDASAVFRRVARAVLDLPPAQQPEVATDPDLLAGAPGVYELPMPGPLTNFRPQNRIGRIAIEPDGSQLMLRSRWGDWKEGVRLTPCDPRDPAFFALRPPAAETAYVALERAADGTVTALRLDELTRMIKRADNDV